MQGLIGIIVFSVLSVFALNILDSSQITTFENVKILDKQQQMLVKKAHTDYRYLVITDKGTFICESNMLQGKFNNSDIFYHIQKDSTYSEMKVSGFGKGFLFDYQNILEIK